MLLSQRLVQPTLDASRRARVTANVMIYFTGRSILLLNVRSHLRSAEARPRHYASAPSVMAIRPQRSVVVRIAAHPTVRGQLLCWPTVAIALSCVCLSARFETSSNQGWLVKQQHRTSK